MKINVNTILAAAATAIVVNIAVYQFKKYTRGIADDE